MSLNTKVLFIPELPIAFNVCQQVLREVDRDHNPNWTAAHVIMNPFAESLLHVHKKMTEIYMITGGYGLLEICEPGSPGIRVPVFPGSVHEIPPEVSHKLYNCSASHLEHLVFADPPFDPSDVKEIKQSNLLVETIQAQPLPEEEECFDGARIISYPFPHLDISMAIGRVINDPDRRKKPHYHMAAQEYIYVLSGKGSIDMGEITIPIQKGNWVYIQSGTEHAFINTLPEDLVIACICSPQFNMEDVHYR